MAVHAARVMDADQGTGADRLPASRRHGRVGDAMRARVGLPGGGARAALSDPGPRPPDSGHRLLPAHPASTVLLREPVEQARRDGIGRTGSRSCR